MTMYKTT